MAKLNLTVCAKNFGNTGIADCPLIPKHIVGMFIVDQSFRITATNALTLGTYLTTSAKADDRKDRIFPIHNFAEIEDGSEDLVTEELGYGGMNVIREGVYDFTFRLGSGDACLQRSLRTFNNRPQWVILYDADGNMFGRNVNGEFAGIPLKFFYAKPFTISDGSGTTTSFNIQITMDPKYLNDDLSFIVTSNETFMLESIQGLIDIFLTKSTGSTLAAVAVTNVNACLGFNFFDEYASEMAAPGMWVVTNMDDGSTMTPSGVVIANGVATLAFAGNADPLKIDLAAPSVLEGGGVVGFEGHPVVVIS